MGQTLTHGIYLPDEGERNCYNGLAANWQILDGAVGTIAEHTTALSGKAPLVHTHTKSDITDFPAYGTTAGTICEGNDSRLSDARTPVAHTHTKSDVTDLLNSNFIPSANNSYDLGSSSYQWNNLYAKGYYYNSVAWGLDKANTWTGTNTFAAVSYGNKIVLKNTGLDLSNGNSGLTDTFLHFIRWVDNSDTVYAMLQGWTKSSNSTISISTRYKTDANTSITAELRLENTGTTKAFYSNSSGDTYLGTSSNKWKTLNGINPGALSLPVTALANTYDISGDITDLTGGNNSITAARTGWIFVKSDNATEISIENTTTGMGASDHSAAAATLMVSIPVTSGETLNIIANCTSIDKAYLLPCQGNV